MNKRMIVLVGMLLISMLTVSFAGETNVGGHVKLTVFDRPTGEHNGESTSNYVGLTLNGLYLFINKEISEKVSVDLQPHWSASTGATPSFGNDIAKKTPAGDIEPHFHGFVKAQVNVLLPNDFELGVGIVKPRFSWDYGAELFWEDQINASKFTANNYLGAVHDSGIELYRNFEIGDISLPTYVYLLNGGYQFGDNNNQPGFLATIEPEFGALKFKASLSLGKYDEDAEKNYMKYLVGAAYDAGAFSARAEYAAGKWSESIVATKTDEGVPLTFKDATPMGYYAKIFYRFADWGRVMLHYDYVDNNYSGFFYTALGSEKFTNIIPGLQLYVSGSSIIQVQYDIADWEQTEKFGIPGQKDTIKYNRLTVGWRTTF